MKRKLSKALCVVLASTVMFSLAACGTKNQPVQSTEASVSAQATTVEKKVEPVTLKLWHIWAADSEALKKPMEKVLNDFEVANPSNKLEVDVVENEAYKIKIKTAAAANELPDVFFTWGAGFAKPFINSGKVLALDEYLNDGTKDRLIEGTTVNLTTNGKIYGLPFSIGVGTFYLNKELFEKNNVKIPETYNELLEAVKAFKAKGIIPMTVGEKDRWPGMFYYDMLALRTAGAQACNSALNKESSFDAPEFADAAAKLSELIKAGAFEKGVMALTRDESEAGFIQGKVAMYFNGSWVAGSLEKEGSPVQGKIIVKKFPVIEGAKGQLNEFFGGASDGFMVSASTQHKEEAVKAVKFIAENMSKESYIAGASLPAWKADIDKSKINPLVAQIADLAKDANGFVMWWDVFLEGADADVHKNLVAEIFAGTKTPEQFTKEMQKLNEKK